MTTQETSSAKMDPAGAPTRESPVSLREINADTVREICDLSNTLSPEHQRMVAPNAVSIAEAHFEPHAWFRAIYAGETPVGFIMLYQGPDEFLNENKQPLHFLWRFMIAGPYHKLGFGRRVLEQVIADLRLQGVKEFYTSCEEGQGSPEGFYRKLGFERTGQVLEEEVVLLLKL